MKMEYEAKWRELDALRKYKHDDGPSPNSRRGPPTIDIHFERGKLPEYHDPASTKNKTKWPTER